VLDLGDETMTAYLKYFSQGSEECITCGTVTSIGRDRGNDVVLSDLKVSRNHALVRRLGKSDYYLIDSGSSNGSRVNGRRITSPTLLVDADRITTGGSSFVFAQESRASAFTNSLSLQATMIMDEPVIKEITILVADIRGFTRISEQLSIQALTRLMNQWFDRVSEAIVENRGTVDKFIGDCIFARWESDNSRDNVINALHTACVLNDVTTGLYQKFPELSEPLRMGVGINTGMASLEVGSDNTALGDAVNLAFRLETASKELGADIVLSESTYSNLPEHFWNEMAQQIKVKGKAAPVKVVGIGYEYVEEMLASPANA